MSVACVGEPIEIVEAPAAAVVLIAGFVWIARFAFYLRWWEEAGAARLVYGVPAILLGVLGIPSFLAYAVPVAVGSIALGGFIATEVRDDGRFETARGRVVVVRVRRATFNETAMFVRVARRRRLAPGLTLQHTLACGRTASSLTTSVEAVEAAGDRYTLVYADGARETLVEGRSP